MPYAHIGRSGGAFHQGVAVVNFPAPTSATILAACLLTEESKDPNNRVLGPKYCNINGIWALKHYYLGPWTLRVCFCAEILNPKP